MRWTKDDWTSYDKDKIRINRALNVDKDKNKKRKMVLDNSSSSSNNNSQLPNLWTNYCSNCTHTTSNFPHTTSNINKNHRYLSPWMHLLDCCGNTQVVVEAEAGGITCKVVVVEVEETTDDGPTSDKLYYFDLLL